jgi:four helix bundle protein
MSEKLELQMPDYYPFQCEMLIRKTDVTMDIHVSFASILDIVFEGHLRFFKSLGYDVTDVENRSLIFANAVILYKGELLADDIVRIEVRADNFLEKGCDLFFHLTKDSGKIIVADIKIRMLFFDYSIRKVALVPEEFKSKCLKLIQGKSKPINIESNKELKNNSRSSLWSSAHQLVLNLYKTTSKLPKEEENHLIFRIKKSATTLPLSIVEYESKKNKLDATKSYSRARGYIEELRYYLILAEDLGYINTLELRNQIEEFSKNLKEDLKKK